MTEAPQMTPEIVVAARELPPPRRFLPDAADIVEIAHVAQAIVRETGVNGIADIPYRYGPTRRRLRIFPGGWFDNAIRRDHESGESLLGDYLAAEEAES
jgi:hypothetical protein